MSVSQAKIDFWIKNNFNVMFVGRHGVGKTAMVTDAFDRHKLRWRYFSASTMDPWCDFIGVPKEKIDNPLCEQMQLVRQIAEVNFSTAVSYIQQNWKLTDKNAAEELVNHAMRDNGPAYLELVRPQDFANDQIEALFFDEFNRSPKKIRNAVMELIQFKSINGKKFSNLKIVWCAINPDNDEALKYDVETLDSAQTDRFQVSVNIPYKPNKDWFRATYGQKFADSAIMWWENLNEETKNVVSPRRLQYALDCFVAKGDPRDILPASSNVNKLIATLKNGPITDQVEEIFKNKDKQAAKDFIQNENNFFDAINHILKSVTMTNFFAPTMAKEKITSLMSSDEKFCKHVIENLDVVPVFHGICKEILKANLDAVLVKKIRKTLTENEKIQKAFIKDSIEEPKSSVAPHFNKNKLDWGVELTSLESMPLNNSHDKIIIYDKIIKNIPEKLDFGSAMRTLKLICKAVEPFHNNLIELDKMFGTVNHCLVSIQKEKKVSFQEIYKMQVDEFNILLNKIRQQELDWKMVRDE